MSEVVKIDGSPGAGKSYTLEKRLEVEKDNGLGAFDFWWLNFTRSGREDVEPALNEMWPAPAPDVKGGDRAKTIHGLALSLCTRNGVVELGTDGEDEIIVQGDTDEDETGHFATFCEDRAIPYNPDAASNRSILAGDSDAKTTGNRLFALNDYLRQTYQTPCAWRDAPVDMKINGEAVKRLLREWEDFKDKRRLYEHGDYVQEAIDEELVPDVDVLLIDEFQDLAPLEYKLYKQWRDDGRVERLYISGDPNQSVYSFRGGTPRYFEGTDKDTTITLKESYRCPEEIAEVGRTILDAHSKTDARGFGGKEPGGTVNWRTIRDKDGLADRVLSLTKNTEHSPAVMLLSRTNRQLGILATDLRKSGIPFKTLGSRGDVWTGSMGNIYSLLTGIGDRDAYSRSEVRDLFKHLSMGRERRQEMSGVGGATFDADSVEGALSDFDSPLAIVDELRFGKQTGWQRDVLRNAVDAPGDLSPEDVQVGTIHTAKGLEAPNVLLFANTPRSIQRRYKRRKDHAAEEHRVYYVGATRASERLTLVEDYFGGAIAPPIDRVRAKGVI